MKVRAAGTQDVEKIATIIAHHASQGLMLPRSLGALSASLDTYVVADAGGELVGCGGLDATNRNPLRTEDPSYAEFVRSVKK